MPSLTCAPPALRMCVAPARLQQYSTSCTVRVSKTTRGHVQLHVQLSSALARTRGSHLNLASTWNVSQGQTPWLTLHVACSQQLAHNNLRKLFADCDMHLLLFVVSVLCMANLPKRQEQLGTCLHGSTVPRTGLLRKALNVTAVVLSTQCTQCTLRLCMYTGAAAQSTELYCSYTEYTVYSMCTVYSIGLEL